MARRHAAASDLAMEAQDFMIGDGGSFPIEDLLAFEMNSFYHRTYENESPSLHPHLRCDNAYGLSFEIAFVRG
ncbi:MAG: hypothetical protein ACI8T1_004691 [Verrucomicrobiales bacterium]|jgi:hypothetical protein